MTTRQIVDVRALVPSSETVGTDYMRQMPGHWIIDSIIANPMSTHPRYRASRSSWGIDVLGTALVEVELDDGTVGVGLTTGGDPVCWLVEHHLKRFALGQDPSDIELIWDQMWRSSLPYGRKGLPIHAISAVDLALWDALGKSRSLPVYALLGGRTKESIPVYATTPRPVLAKELGFIGAKLLLRSGPADGRAGMAENLNMLKKARAEVGPDFDLMLDCYMSLDLAYASTLMEQAKDVGLKWIEEPLVPDDYRGLAELRTRVAPALVTTGEHEYTRYGFRALLERQAADILQPDILWCGGITEARRIVALAAAYDIPVVPHGSGVYSYHLQVAFINCPYAEFLIMSPDADRVVPIFGDLFIDEPLPQDGVVEIGDAPGFGVRINPSVKLVRPYPTRGAE